MRIYAHKNTGLAISKHSERIRDRGMTSSLRHFAEFEGMRPVREKRKSHRRDQHNKFTQRHNTATEKPIGNPSFPYMDIIIKYLLVGAHTAVTGSCRARPRFRCPCTRRSAGCRSALAQQNRLGPASHTGRTVTPVSVTRVILGDISQTSFPGYPPESEPAFPSPCHQECKIRPPTAQSR